MNSECNLNMFAIVESDCSRKEDEKEQIQSKRSRLQRDRDRIITSQCYRRLAGKTQVFMADVHDHVRNRLTHTLEVSLIANTITKRLRLNEDLTDAIAHGHDVGHAPYGHSGERVLNEIMNDCKRFNTTININDQNRGFKHNRQGFRVLSYLEDKNKEYIGLNLSAHTLWGIINHTSKTWDACDKPCNHYYNEPRPCNRELSTAFYDAMEDHFIKPSDWSFEALVVKIADDVAQKTHDISDGFEFHLIKFGRIIDVFNDAYSEFLSPEEQDMMTRFYTDRKSIFDVKDFIRFLTRFYIKHIINDFNRMFSMIQEEYRIQIHDEFNELKNTVSMDDIYSMCFCTDFEKASRGFQDFLKTMIIKSSVVQDSDARATYILTSLFDKYIANPMLLPDKTIIAYLRNLDPEEYLELRQQIDIHDTSQELAKITRSKLFSNLFNKWKLKDDVYNTLMRTICDYISGMTDHHADKKFKLLHGITPYN